MFSRFAQLSARTRRSNGVRRFHSQQSVVWRHRAAKESMPFHSQAKRGAGGGLVGTSHTTDTPRKLSPQSGRSNKLTFSEENLRLERIKEQAETMPPEQKQQICRSQITPTTGGKHDR